MFATISKKNSIKNFWNNFNKFLIFWAVLAWKIVVRFKHTEKHFRNVLIFEIFSKLYVLYKGARASK